MSARSLISACLGFAWIAGLGCTVENAGNGGTDGTMISPMAGASAMAGTGTGGVAGARAGVTAGTGTGGSAGVMAGTGTGGAAGTMAGTGTGGSAGVMAGTGTGGAAGTMAGTGTGGAAGVMGEPDGGDGDPTQACIADAAADGRTGACVECGCASCLDTIDNCADEACLSVVRCGQTAGCKGRDCYCGDTVDAVTCAILGASGPCMMEIATAAGVCDMAAPNTCASTLSSVTNPTSMMYDAQNPVSRANQLSVCTRGQVADPGVTGLVPPVEAIAGMCETECM